MGREMLLAGKSAVITGAGSGVGRASALRFAAAGARVVCADISIGWAKETAAQREAAGGTAVPLECDVAAEDDVAAAVTAAVEQFGRLDIMFNNAGIPARRGTAIEDHTVEDLERLVSVNLRGVFLGCKHAVRQFKRQGDGGVILNTGSTAGLVGVGDVLYGATKGGVHQLTRGIAIECAPFGIRANAICPAGMPHANFTAAGGTEVPPGAMQQYADRIGAMHPLGRPITVWDCAEAAAYLVSDLAVNVTGALLPVDGGYLAK
jgi:NAD(P)-dependent dehydrogenase (short-subunit alcohol dehydrogenase family)